MAYWNNHALGHSSEVLDGNFVSPVTNEVMTLSWAERAIAEAILKRLPTDKTNPWGERIAWVITNKNLSAWAGKYISPPLYAKSITNLELAGVLEVTRERGEGHKVTIGRLLRCDLDQCQEPLHYPYEYPLPKLSPPLVEDMGELIKPEETPLVHLDIKNLNNPLITLNTLSEGSNDLESLQRSSEPKENQEPLLPLWEEWTWASARRKGLPAPSRYDIAEARRLQTLTGEDLEPGGAWIDGRPNPIPGNQLSKANN